MLLFNLLKVDSHARSITIILYDRDQPTTYIVISTDLFATGTYYIVKNHQADMCC